MHPFVVPAQAETHRSAAEFLDDRQQQFSIHFIETIGVDFHAIQRVVCDLLRDAPVFEDIGDVVEHRILALGLDPGNRFVDSLLSKTSHLRPEQIKELGLGSFLYAGLFLAEGTGLWLRKRWGEWLTVIITGSLLPVEALEIYRHPRAVKVMVLVVNLAIVAYLIHHIRESDTTTTA